MTNWIVENEMGKPATDYSGSGNLGRYWGPDGKLLRNGTVVLNGHTLIADENGWLTKVD